jgi:hypothetical protein
VSHPLENAMLSAELPEIPLVCIVKFRDDLQFGLQIPQTPAVHFQVTVKKANCSPSGEFIRFGGKGDELVGWFRREYLLVCEVLGQVQADGVTVAPIQINGMEEKQRACA